MLVLASNSPRRRELLALGGWEFNILVCEVDESVRTGEKPADYVRRLAESKARAAQSLLTREQLDHAVILAADTTVVDPPDDSNGHFEILGKPVSGADAERMLRRLRGRVHQVITAVAVLRADGRLRCETVATEVPMRDYSEAEMLEYIASGDPLDKAGAYGIQHAGFRPVPYLHGCYPNVMGLPVCRVAALLAEAGLPAAAQATATCHPETDVPCRVYERVTQGADERG